MINREEEQKALRTKVLSHVKYAEKSLALLETLSAAYSQVPSDVKDAFSKIQSFFIERELNAHRNLLLILATVGDDEDQEATKMAFKRFLSVDMSIMHFWSHNGEIPGTWLDKDESRLRELFKEVERDLNGKRRYIKRDNPKPRTRKK